MAKPLSYINIPLIIWNLGFVPFCPDISITPVLGSLCSRSLQYLLWVVAVSAMGVKKILLWVKGGFALPHGKCCGYPWEAFFIPHGRYCGNLWQILQLPACLVLSMLLVGPDDFLQGDLWMAITRIRISFSW